MYHFNKHIIKQNTPLQEVLKLFNEIAPDAIAFVLDENERLIGSITDGDIRRGFIKGKNVNDSILEFINSKTRTLKKGDYTINDIVYLRNEDLKIVPVVNRENKIVNVVNFSYHKSYLPIDAVIMAGGKGERLMPLTETTPKPLLRVANKPIIEHNIDRLATFGIDDFWISVRYLGKQIEGYLNNGRGKNLNIEYIYEKEPLGTIGAVKLVKNFEHNYVLVTNSDILTNLDYEDFFLDFLEKDADISVFSIPYHVDIPYAVLEIEENSIIKSFKEKPTKTFYSNGGIYLMKTSMVDYIPSNIKYNATDLLQFLIDKKKIVTTYQSRGSYWLDIGKHEDYRKAQEDIKHIKF